MMSASRGADLVQITAAYENKIVRARARTSSQNPVIQLSEGIVYNIECVCHTNIVTE